MMGNLEDQKPRNGVKDWFAPGPVGFGFAGTVPLLPESSP